MRMRVGWMEEAEEFDNAIESNLKIWSDIEEIDAFNPLSDQALHRNVDKKPLPQTAKLETAVICLRDIYCPGRVREDAKLTLRQC